MYAQHRRPTRCCASRVQTCPRKRREDSSTYREGFPWRFTSSSVEWAWILVVDLMGSTDVLPGPSCWSPGIGIRGYHTGGWPEPGWTILPVRTHIQSSLSVRFSKAAKTGRVWTEQLRHPPARSSRGLDPQAKDMEEPAVARTVAELPANRVEYS